MNKNPQIVIALGLCLVLFVYGCNNKTEVSPSPTRTVGSLSTPSYLEIYRWPWITATPIALNNTQDLAELLKQYYSLNDCKSAPTQSQIKVTTPQFIKIDSPFNYYEYNIWQIADDSDASYRAYLANEEYPCPGLPYTCSLSRVYIVEQASGRAYKLNWGDDFLVSRPIVMMVWVGNNILTLLLSPAPHAALLVGIGIREQDLLYYSTFICP